VLLCAFINDNEEKNVSKTNYKLDRIWRNSNSDYDIYRVFNAFPLNLTSIRLFDYPTDYYQIVSYEQYADICAKIVALSEDSEAV